MRSGAGRSDLGTLGAMEWMVRRRGSRAVFKGGGRGSWACVPSVIPAGLAAAILGRAGRVAQRPCADPGSGGEVLEGGRRSGGAGRWGSCPGGSGGAGGPRRSEARAGQRNSASRVARHGEEERKGGGGGADRRGPVAGGWWARWLGLGRADWAGAAERARLAGPEWRGGALAG